MKPCGKLFLTSFVLLLSSFVLKVEAKEAVVYSRLTDGYWQIWMMSPDGKDKKQVTVSLQDKRDPTWLKGGAKIAFRTHNSELFTVNADGTDETQHLSEYGVVTNPDFSPGGNEIIFVRFEAGPGDISDIWKLNMDTSNSEIVTRDHQPKYQPKFSPDGREIAFVRIDDQRQNYHIWKASADGSEPRQLTRTVGFDTHPEFSPDQKSIIFASNRNKGIFDIYSVDAVTGKENRLTKYEGLDTHPGFSPDGQKIVFVSDESGSQQLWIMSADGTGRRQLTFDTGECIDPEWGEIKEFAQ